MQFGNVVNFNVDLNIEDATQPSNVDVFSIAPEDSQRKEHDETMMEPESEFNALDAQLKEAAKIIRHEDEDEDQSEEYYASNVQVEEALEASSVDAIEHEIAPVVDDSEHAAADLCDLEDASLPVDDALVADQAPIEVDQSEKIVSDEALLAESPEIENHQSMTDHVDRLTAEETSHGNEGDATDTTQSLDASMDISLEDTYSDNVLQEPSEVLPTVTSPQVEQVKHQAVNEEENGLHDEVDHVALPKIGKVGRLLLGLGKITAKDTKKILSEQKKNGLLFGDAALKLGLINQSDIQQVVALQFNYNYLQAGQGNFHDDLISVYTPFIKKAEAYRALRSQLMMKWFKKGNRVLAIGSANRQEGVSYLTANLGVVFAQLGARTLIIEANMRTPRQHAIFNPYDNIGLSDVLVGRANTEEAIKDVLNIPDLSLLTAGTIPPNPQELLGRTSFNILIKTLKDHYDVILIDTPAAIESADAQSAFELAQGVLFVSRLDHTKHDDVLNVTNQIEMSEAILVGAVMNEF